MILLKTPGRLVPVVVLSLGLAACGGVVREIPDETDPDQTAVNQPIEYATLPGDVGLWQLPEDANITAETTSFTIEVMRLACADGECELGESGYVSDCEDSMRWDPESGAWARLF